MQSASATQRNPVLTITLGMSGSGGKDCVDAIWHQLKQQESKTKDKTRLESLWKHVQSGSLSSKASIKPATLKQLVPQQQQQGSNIRAGADYSQAACDALCSKLQNGSAVSQLTSALQSLDVRAVKAALQQLQEAVDSPASAWTFPTSKLCKALLRCFDSRTEACRDKAVSCCSRLLEADPDAVLGLLPYTMPVLVERLQCDESHKPTEPSEEVRLKLVQLLVLIMDQAGSAIAAYASEVWSMVTAVLSDSFHEVSMQGCKVAQRLAAILGLRLGATSKELVAALLPLTTHKRYRVRIAAIEAIRDVMHQGAHEMVLEMVAWRDPNLVPIKAFYGDDLKVNFCGKLATDPHVQVRLAFLDMIGNWLLTLRDRRDHEARLLPYVLSGISDDSPAVVESALQLLDQLGAQYEKEHESGLADMLRFADKLEDGTEARLMQLMQTGRVRYAGSWDVLTQAQQESTAAAAVAVCQMETQQEAPFGSARQQQAPMVASAAAAGVFVLPGPFKQRVRLGSRVLVRGTFSSLLPALCRELSAWQSCPRVMSARLLLVSLLMVESAAEQYLQAILPALCAAVCDEEAGATAQACATVLGSFCPLQRVLDLLKPRMEDWADTPQRQAGALMLLAAVVRGAGPLQQFSSHGVQLLQLLLDLEISSSLDSRIRAAMMQLVQQLLVPHTLQQLIAGGSSCTQAAAAAAEGTGAPDEAAAAAGAEATSLISSSSSSNELADCESDAPVVPGQLLNTGSQCSTEVFNSAGSLLQQLLQQLLDSSTATTGNSPGLEDAVGKLEWLAAALQQVRVM